ncbi:MAG: CFI-box-CTERM domain-containing protein, partial [archaeon]
MNVDNRITDNTIYNNYLTAIRTDHVQTLLISGNTMYNNWRFGPNSTGGNILLAQVIASYMQYCNRDVTIYNNRVHTAVTNGTGIYIQNATNVPITYNDIYLNGGAGVGAAPGANQLQIHHNDIRNNGGNQAWDVGTSNNWDDGSRGNYWSSYTGTDTNNDGIGDQPFQIYPTYVGRKDYFPLMRPLLFIVTTTYSTTTATSTVPAYVTTSFTTTLYSTTSVLTSISTTVTTTTTTTTAPGTQTILGTLTSYFITVSTPTTVVVFVTSSTSTSTTITTTSTSTILTTTTLTTAVTTSVTTSAAARRCIIASAAYESDIAPAVQFLRDFRDLRIGETFAGKSFMDVFNGFYYSFSTAVADAISKNDLAKAATRAILAPLLTSLWISEGVFGLCSESREVATVASGLVASTLIGVMYSFPLLAVNQVMKKKEKKGGLSLYPLGLVWLGALIVLAIGEFMWSPFLVMTGSATLVLATVVLAPLIVWKMLRRLLP